MPRLSSLSSRSLTGQGVSASSLPTVLDTLIIDNYNDLIEPDVPFLLDPSGTYVYRAPSSVGANFFTARQLNSAYDILNSPDYAGTAETVDTTGIFGFVYGIAARVDGGAFYVCFEDNDTNVRIRQYILTTTWPTNIEGTVAATSTSPAIAGSLYHIKFSTDGLYLFGRSSGGITRYTLTVPYDITTLNPGSIVTNALSSDWPDFPEQLLFDFAFNAEGTKMLLTHGYQYISEYNLSTPWNISTLNYAGLQVNLNDLLGVSYMSRGTLRWYEAANRIILAASTDDFVNRWYVFTYGGVPPSLPRTSLGTYGPSEGVRISEIAYVSDTGVSLPGSEQTYTFTVKNAGGDVLDTYTPAFSVYMVFLNPSGYRGSGYGSYAFLGAYLPPGGWLGGSDLKTLLETSGARSVEVQWVGNAGDPLVITLQ